MTEWTFARDGREDEEPPSNPKKEKVFKEMYPVLCACMERKGFCLKSKNITAKAKALLALTKSINKRNKASRKKNPKLGVTNIARYPDDSFCPSGRYPTRPTLCSLNGGTVTKVTQVSVVDMVWFCSLINWLCCCFAEEAIEALCKQPLPLLGAVSHPNPHNPAKLKALIVKEMQKRHLTFPLSWNQIENVCTGRALVLDVVQAFSSMDK